MSETVKKELEIKENIKPVKLTLLTTKTDLSNFPELEKLTNQANETIEDMKKGFVKLGFLLIKIKSNKNLQDVYSDEKCRPCKDIYEFAKQEFKLSKAMTSVFMGIARRFGYEVTENRLRSKYEPYSQTQLQEMLPLSDSQLELVNPDMTIQEIKALKKVRKVVQLTEQKTDSEKNCGYDQGIALKNDSQRLDFFKRYKDWGVWLSVPELSMKFYKCMFNNGDYALVTEIAFERKNFEGKKETLYNSHFQIIRAGTGAVQYYSSDHYSFSEYSGTQICDYFKETKAKVLFDYVAPVKEKE